MKNDISAVFAVAEAHPNVFILNVYTAAIKGYGQSERLMQAALSFLDRVSDQYPQVTPREQQWFDAVQAWIALRLEEAIERFEAITEQWPQDLVALKCCEFLYFLCGQQYLGQRYLAHTNRLAATYGDHPDFLACHAFATELAGHPMQALQLAERAINLAPAQAWAHHALSHSYYMTHDLETGLHAFVEFSKTWDQADVILTGHNRWHLAVFRLMTGDIPAALAMLDKLLWIEPIKTVPAQQVEAISLAWRIELAGGVVPDAFWQEVVRYAEPDRTQFVNPFLAAHYVYAFVRAGKLDWVDATLKTVQQHIAQHTGSRQKVWQMGASLLQAVSMFAQGDYIKAGTLFKTVQPEWPIGGGSDAQVDLFVLSYQTACNR